MYIVQPTASFLFNPVLHEETKILIKYPRQTIKNLTKILSQVWASFSLLPPSLWPSNIEQEKGISLQFSNWNLKSFQYCQEEIEMTQSIRLDKTVSEQTL